MVNIQKLHTGKGEAQLRKQHFECFTHNLQLSPFTRNKVDDHGGN